MIRKVVIASCAIALLVGSLALGATGCTRAKKEVATPALLVAVATLTLTPTGPTPITVFTPEAPPTPITPAAGPTTIIARVAFPHGNSAGDGGPGDTCAWRVRVYSAMGGYAVFSRPAF